MGNRITGCVDEPDFGLSEFAKFHTGGDAPQCNNTGTTSQLLLSDALTDIRVQPVKLLCNIGKMYLSVHITNCVNSDFRKEGKKIRCVVCRDVSFSADNPSDYHYPTVRM